MRAALAILALAGCGGPPVEIVGPFTGKTHRFVVDAITLPSGRTDFEEDLNGDNIADNAAGTLIGALWALTSKGEGPDLAAAAQLGSGAVTPIVEITTDDNAVYEDPSVGVRWIDGSGPETAPMGGALSHGHIATNRALYFHDPVAAEIRLPVAGAADPVQVDVVGVDVDIASDGQGGFSGAFHAAIDMRSPAQFYAEVSRVVAQITDAWPQDHPMVYSLFDSDQDCHLSESEVIDNPIIKNVLFPDVQLFDAAGNWQPTQANSMKNAFSVGFGFHLKPCASGACLAQVAPSCIDRVKNGDETDVDCGGAKCHPCKASLACNGDGDCQGNCMAGRCTQLVCQPGSCGCSK